MTMRPLVIELSAQAICKTATGNFSAHCPGRAGQTRCKPMTRPSIFDYLDYRSFLKDMFTFRKAKDAFFSYRYFSQKAGFASPNFLKLVVDGKRNLTNDSIGKVARGFTLKKPEREFLENLVFMNQATDHADRNYYYRKMMSVRGYRKVQKLAGDRYDYFSRWYYPVVREIVVMGKGNLTSAQIGSLLRPKIRPNEAKSALNLLARLKLIQKEADNGWQPCHGDITTGPEIKSLVVANFHKEMLKLAAASIERFNAPERDISALTLSIERERFDEIKSRIIEFRKELMTLAGNDENPDQVVQVNIQLFPLTQ